MLNWSCTNVISPPPPPLSLRAPEKVGDGISKVALPPPPSPLTLRAPIKVGDDAIRVASPPPPVVSSIPAPVSDENKKQVTFLGSAAISSPPLVSQPPRIPEATEITCADEIGEIELRTPEGAKKGFTSDVYNDGEDKERQMVPVEFVWPDGAEESVELAGGWNCWMSIPMYNEGGNTWSIITKVPVGTHEFRFIVDREWKGSPHRPLNESVDDPHKAAILESFVLHFFF